MAVLVTDCREECATSEKVIADIAGAAYGYFAGAGKRLGAD